MLNKNLKEFLIQFEVFLLIICGIIGLSFDSFLFFDFYKDLEKVWLIALDPYKFPPLHQLYLKYLLSLFIIIRTFTVHTTIAFYFVLLWPAIFAEKPCLLIPWLCLGTLRLSVDIMATFTGLYICSAYGIFNILWIEFLIVQIIEHGPFFYIWLTIMNYKKYLNDKNDFENKLMEDDLYKIKNRRKSRKQMREPKGFIEYIDSNRSKTFSQTILLTIIEEIRKKKRSLTSRSIDTLLELIGQKESDDDDDDIDDLSMSYDVNLKSSSADENNKFFENNRNSNFNERGNSSNFMHNKENENQENKEIELKNINFNN